MAKIIMNNPVVEAIDSASAQRDSGVRYHLGASLLGHPCDRWLWINFHWAVKEIFPGRIVRLFDRGQEEEDRQIQYMELAGMKVTGQQDRVEFSVHLSGSMDGVVVGVPGAEKTKHIWECKTHNKKSFDDLEKKGVEKSKPMHYAQMQVYMKGKKLKRALYYAVCKDDDRIYAERVRLDEELAKKYIARGIRISYCETLPEPLSADPSWYQCKYCAAYSMCHENTPSREVNCRTCAHSTATEQGWKCERWNDLIPKKNQIEGCRSHVWHPDLVPWEMEGSKGDWTAIYNGIANGEEGISSAEMLIAGGV